MGKFYELHLLDGLEPGLALWLAQRWLRNLPSWRQDCLAAGVTEGATGPDAPTVVAELVQQRDEITLLDEIAAVPGGGRAEANGAGSGEDRSQMTQLRLSDATHWAAFAYYGA
jgi:hypothetical protein